MSLRGIMSIIVLVIASLAYLPLSAPAQGTSTEAAAVIEDLVAANRILPARGLGAKPWCCGGEAVTVYERAVDNVEESEA